MAGIARYYDESKNEGGTNHIYGVPLADITEEQYEALPDWMKDQVDASPMYRKTAVSDNKDKKPAAAPKDAPKEEG